MGTHTTSVRSCVVPLLMLAVVGVAHSQATDQSNINMRDIINTLEPITRASPAFGEDDHFGGALTFHRVSDVVLGDISASMDGIKVIIGAPLGNYSGGLDCDEFNIPCTVFSNYTGLTGLVYTCDVAPGRCGPLRGTGSTLADGSLFRSASDRETGTALGSVFAENTTLQFMGQTILSSGGYLVACAPRYVFRARSTDDQPKGQCFFSTDRNLQQFHVIGPCADSSFGRSDRTDFTGYCMSGSSVSINDGKLYFGSPWFDDGRGGVTLFDATNQGFVDGIITSTISLSYGSSTDFVPVVLEPLEMANGLVYDGEFDNHEDIANLGTGFAIDNGHVISRDAENIVASVPRWNISSYLGSVVVYDADSLDASWFTTASINVYGETMAEFFGYDIALLDLTGDGLDDLVVGAPMYSDISTDSDYEYGRVYVFRNDEGQFAEDPMIICPRRHMARFGMVVDSLGDINNDGYQDFVVAAPYEVMPGRDDCAGAVYIYTGSPDPKAMCTFRQKIHACDVVDTVVGLAEMKAFGYSLATKEDIDGNNYNDLAVGTYESQTVVIFRTFPVADVNISLTLSPMSLDLLSESCTYIYDGKTYPCLDINVCLVYDGRPSSLENQLEVTYKLLAPSDKTFFNDTNQPTSVTRTRMLTLNTMDCSPETYFLKKENLEANDFRSGFTVNVTFEQLQPMVNASVTIDGNQTATDLSAAPLLRINGDTTIMVPIARACKSEICQIDLVLQLDNVTYLGPENSPRSDLTAGAVSIIRVDLTLTNSKEDAAQDVRLQIATPDYINRENVHFRRNGGVSVLCKEDRNITGVVCEVAFIVDDDDTDKIVVEFPVTSDLTGRPSDAANLNFTVGSQDQNTTEGSVQNNNVVVELTPIAKASVKAQLTFSPDSVTYNIQSKPEETPETVSALGDQVNMVLTVVSEGPTTVGQVDVKMYLPARSDITGPYYFLYPTEIGRNSATQGSADVVCSNNTAGLNPEGYNTTSQASRRRRRAAMSLPSKLRLPSLQAWWDSGSSSGSGSGSEDRSKRQDDNNVDAMFDLSCVESPASCIEYTCTVTNLDPFDMTLDARVTVPIFVRAYVDERFLYEKSVTYTLQGSAEVSIPASFNYLNDATSDNTDSAKLELMRAASQPEFNIHYVIWPAIAALILLVIVAVVLYFVGFFRRKKPEEQQDVEGVGDAAAASPAEKGGASEEPEKKGLEEVAEL